MSRELPPRETNDSAISDESFDRQFARRYDMKSDEGNWHTLAQITEAVDVVPDVPKKGALPVFLAQAWGLANETYGPVLKEIAQDGERAVSVSHPRVGGDVSSRASKEDIEKYSEAELRKSLTINDTFEARKVERADILAHSEGVLNALIFAKTHPEKVRNLALMAPPGLIGKDTFLRLMKGFTGQSKRAETLRATWPLNVPETATLSIAVNRWRPFACEPSRSCAELMAK